MDEADDRRPLWVVYDHPIDFPDSFVCRRWCLTIPADGQPFEEPAEVLCALPTLDAVHERLPKGLSNIVHTLRELMGEQVDRKIVEVWL